MINLNKYTILFLIVFFLNGCSTIKENLTLKKKSNVDQFLVEKKNPLVLPPNFEELPIPITLITQDPEVEKKDENFNIRDLLNKESEGNLAVKNIQKDDPAIKESIMKKINKN